MSALRHAVSDHDISAQGCESLFCREALILRREWERPTDQNDRPLSTRLTPTFLSAWRA